MKAPIGPISPIGPINARVTATAAVILQKAANRDTSTLFATARDIYPGKIATFDSRDDNDAIFKTTIQPAQATLGFKAPF